ncbi:MAG: hypothetical protein ABSE96_19290 [Terracidiphilus sp.]|jgi:hypothetical protein
MTIGVAQTAGKEHCSGTLESLVLTATRYVIPYGARNGFSSHAFALDAGLAGPKVFHTPSWLSALVYVEAVHDQGSAIPMR